MCKQEKDFTSKKHFAIILTFTHLLIYTACKKGGKPRKYPSVDVGPLLIPSQFPCKLSTVQTRESTKGCYVHMYHLLHEEKTISLVV